MFEVKHTFEESEKKGYTAVIELTPAFTPPEFLRPLDEEKLKELLVKTLNPDNLPKNLVELRSYLRRLLEKDPLMVIALRLTGVRRDEIIEGVIERGKVMQIFDENTKNYGRRMLMVFFLTLEWLISLFGKHPKFNDMIKFVESHINEFLKKYAFYPTKVTIEKINDVPTVRVTIEVKRDVKDVGKRNVTTAETRS